MLGSLPLAAHDMVISISGYGSRSMLTPRLDHYPPRAAPRAYRRQLGARDPTAAQSA